MNFHKNVYMNVHINANMDYHITFHMNIDLNIDSNIHMDVCMNMKEENFIQFQSLFHFQAFLILPAQPQLSSTSTKSKAEVSFILIQIQPPDRPPGQPPVQNSSEQKITHDYFKIIQDHFKDASRLIQDQFKTTLILVLSPASTQLKTILLNST